MEAGTHMLYMEGSGICDENILGAKAKLRCTQ